MARSFPLAGFGGCAALFRWWGYFVPHLRALIWNAFSCRIAQPRGFPSGGSYHRRGRMRGRPGCPTGQEKKPVGATGSNPLFYKERLGTESPPHPPQCAHWGTFPPRGRLCAVLPFPSAKPPLPARPAGGRAVTGVGKWAAGQAKKEGGPPQGPPQLEKVGPGRKNLFLPGVLSPDFLQRKSGSPAVIGGAPGALRPKVASEPPTPRVRTTVMPLVWLAGFEFRSLLTRLKDAGIFCVP